MLSRKSRIPLLVVIGISLISNIVHVSACDQSEDQCDAKTGECSANGSNGDGNKNQYTAEANSPSRWQKYLDKIDKAVADYEECLTYGEKKHCSSCYKSQIDLDLRPWATTKISKDLIGEALKLERQTHYQIIDGKLYRDDSQQMFPFRNTGIEHFLLKVASKLPDTEFVLNTRDWPQTSVHFRGPPGRENAARLPIFSFSKVAKDSVDIMYPAWTFWAGGPAVWPIYPNGLGRWDEQRTLISASAKATPWDDKLWKGFFRGSRTSAERDPLVLLSRSEPALVDAQYTKNQAWRSEADTLGAKPAKEVTLEDHCAYKYLFNFRGVAASFRHKHLFLCRSLVFHVGDEWLEFYYSAMKPWVHYVPVSQGLQEARELLEFAVENDGVAEEIAERGRKFIDEHLRMSDVECYWRELLTEYTKLLKYKPVLDKKLKRVLAA